MKRQKQPNAKKRSKKSSPIIKISLLILVLFVVIASIFKITEFILTNINRFPKLEISLTDVPIEQINLGTKDVKYPNNTATLTTHNLATTFENVEFKGRGNLTWAQAKKPYQIKLPEKTSLFGYPSAKKWLLLADYLDETHLRNNLAFYLQHIFNSNYPISGDYVELYIDNVYYGLYYLTEKVEIDKNRINLKNPFGAIIELDNLHNSDESCTAYSKNGDCFMVHDIVNQDNSATVISTFTEKFNQLEIAISQKDYSTITSLIDIDSFAKYFLLSEFSNNPDAYSSSFFFYTDGTDDLIHAAAGWDFDLSFGNKKQFFENIDYELFLSPFNTSILKEYIPMNSTSKTSSDQNIDRLSSLLYNLMDIPEFKTRVREIYQETLSGKGDDLLNYIQNQASYIKEAALRDANRWKLQTDFDEEIDYLIDWVAKRYNHFEQTYNINSNTPEPTLNEFRILEEF